jgi:hypothetical protein
MTVAALRDELTTVLTVHRLIQQHERPDLVALSKFHTSDWRSLSLAQLKQLNAILLNRRAARECAARMERQQLRLFPLP